MGYFIIFFFPVGFELIIPCLLKRQIVLLWDKLKRKGSVKFAEENLCQDLSFLFVSLLFWGKDVSNVLPEKLKPPLQLTVTFHRGSCLAFTVLSRSYARYL